jgi:hypothetical protein
LLRTCACWSISELSTFPHQLKLLGWTGWCMQLNMVLESQRSRVRILAGALIKIITAHSKRSRVRIMAGALIKIITAHSNIHICGLGECWSISELSTFPHQLKHLGWTGWCMQLNSAHRPALVWLLMVLSYMSTTSVSSIGYIRISKGQTI